MVVWSCALSAEVLVFANKEVTMPTYNVTIPIAGHAFKTVEADSEEEAIEKAMEEVSIDEIDEWGPLMRFNQGNVCYCPSPWEAEAELDD